MSLDRLLGTWNTAMQHVAVPDPVAGQQRYERVLDDAYVQMHATYAHPDFPDAIAMLEADRYHYFDVRGMTRVYELAVTDTGWTMIRRDADFWQRSSTTFVGTDAMEGTGENSHDQGATWEHDFVMSYARVN